MSEPTSDRPLALVTGASSGIGLELAHEFARAGFDLVVAAEDEGVNTAAATLREDGVDVRAIQVDLRSHAGVERLWAQATEGTRVVDAVALNAGVGRGGAFLDQDLQDVYEVIEVNVISTVHLARLVLADMVERGAGRVLITSSIASTMPGSFQAVYNASKSFLQSFTEALQDEPEGHRGHHHRADAGPDRHELLPPRGHGRHTRRPGQQGRPRTGCGTGVPGPHGRQAEARRRVAQDQGAGRGERRAARQAEGRRAPPDGRAHQRAGAVVSTDAIVVLKDEHKEIRRQFKAFERAEDDVEERGRVVARIIEPAHRAHVPRERGDVPRGAHAAARPRGRRARVVRGAPRRRRPGDGAWRPCSPTPSGTSRRRRC
nr:SDR family NAD(P)-dependent oxidoreductase [Angustibacter aerolatus]